MTIERTIDGLHFSISRELVVVMTAATDQHPFPNFADLEQLRRVVSEYHGNGCSWVETAPSDRPGFASSVRYDGLVSDDLATQAQQELAALRVRCAQQADEIAMLRAAEVVRLTAGLRQ